MGRFRSGQTGQTVNLLVLDLRWFESSPAQIYRFRDERPLAEPARPLFVDERRDPDRLLRALEERAVDERARLLDDARLGCEPPR